jgi:hypothetical protein
MQLECMAFDLSTATHIGGGSVSRARLAKGAVFAVLLPLVVATAVVAMLEGAGLLALPYDMLIVDRAAPGLFRLHMAASGFALVLLPLVLAVRHKPNWHRPAGRIAAVAVVVGGLTALPVAVVSHSPALARAGLFMQGIIWLALIGAGFAAIRAGRYRQHAKCMVAMAAVASGALWVRFVTAAAATWQLPFEAVYSVICWLGWLLPLVVVLVLSSTRRPREGKLAGRA